MKRGEIYYVGSRPAWGHETMKSRPAIIVSNNALNDTSEVVEVVYLTTQPKKEMPTHATIRATGRESVAICEHIDHIDKEKLGDYCGRCSEQEMQAVDAALRSSLALDAVNVTDVLRASIKPNETAELQKELQETRAERDFYKKLLEKFVEVWP